jgi:hypothetical protein
VGACTEEEQDEVKAMCPPKIGECTVIFWGRFDRGDSPSKKVVVVFRDSAKWIFAVS